MQLSIALLALSCSAIYAVALPEHAGLSILEQALTRSGKATWYLPGLGNCGSEDTSDDLVVAISKKLYDKNKGINCGQYVQITNVANNQVAYGLVEDSCPGCGINDLDLSPALFKKLAPLDQGVVQITWKFKSKNWQP